MAEVARLNNSGGHHPDPENNPSNDNPNREVSDEGNNKEYSGCLDPGCSTPIDPEQYKESNEADSSLTLPTNTDDEAAEALRKRRQPLLELVESEEGYVRRLRMIKEFYIPLVSNRTTVSPPIEQTQSSSNLANSASLRETSGSIPAPLVPDDLAARWRILWGNWIQLCDWHSAFLEKLSSFVESDPEKIPKLFIDSRSRLRSIYSKYCENHRKAALIAEQYRDYFEELRLYLNDKEDVVSYLMQPVQRIMRYQLPMAEIVKYTQRAGLPELSLWRRALDIMKEIPKDTQLILEAARIDGFSGVITALGNILIRGDLLVASTTREQLLETVAGYKVALQEFANVVGYLSSKSSQLTAASAPVESSLPTEQTSGHPAQPLGFPHSPDSMVISEPTELYTGNLKFTECRLFLFEQMLVVTEEVKPKRRVTTDTFAQSTYQFRAAINVNKMRYESHWYNCNLPNGHTNADAAAVDQLLSTGFAPDDLRFAVLDQTPGRDTVYVIDPITSANRQAWVVQLRDIQRMQQEFLLALQDPRRFNTGNRDDNWGTDFDSPDSHHLRSDSHAPVVSVHNAHLPGSGQQQQQQQQSQRQRKWPSFTVKRPGRLGSASSPTSKETLTAGAKAAGRSLIEASEDRTANLARSLSAERRTVVRTKLDMGTSIADSKYPGQADSATHGYRKSSLSASSSIKISNEVRFPESPDTPGSEAKGIGVGKKRNVFANLFSRNKSKNRGKHAQPPSTRTLSPASTFAGLEQCDDGNTKPTSIATAGNTDEHATTNSSSKIDCHGE